MRVLIVEDNAALCSVFQEFLAAGGHEPVVVHTAEAALDEIRAMRPDVVILDLYLPGMSGLDFLRLPSTRQARVPVIAISGHATESQARQALALGAYDFVGKPVPLERLEGILAFGWAGA